MFDFGKMDIVWINVYHRTLSCLVIFSFSWCQLILCYWMYCPINACNCKFFMMVFHDEWSSTNSMTTNKINFHSHNPFPGKQVNNHFDINMSGWTKKEPDFTNNYWTVLNLGKFVFWCEIYLVLIFLQQLAIGKYCNVGVNLLLSGWAKWCVHFMTVAIFLPSQGKHILTALITYISN